jgi:mannose-6-phosphate isomerase-like protein (cupin superfamily)
VLHYVDYVQIGATMAQRGQTLENPASGERITFRQTSANTGGELLAIDLELPANRRVPGRQHIHPQQAERFEVVEGTMRFKLGRKRVVAGPGEVVVVPPARSTTSRTSATVTRSSASKCARR